MKILWLNMETEEYFLATTHGGKYYNEETYEPGDFIMFGRESCRCS